MHPYSILVVRAGTSRHAWVAQARGTLSQQPVHVIPDTAGSGLFEAVDAALSDLEGYLGEGTAITLRFPPDSQPEGLCGDDHRLRTRLANLRRKGVDVLIAAKENSPEADSLRSRGLMGLATGIRPTRRGAYA